jgi:hypothetical protein
MNPKWGVGKRSQLERGYFPRDKRDDGQTVAHLPARNTRHRCCTRFAP